jgi:hypothetical protein
VPVLDAAALFACLDRHCVGYVLIGGLAAVVHGSLLPTVGADICPSGTFRTCSGWPAPHGARRADPHARHG